MKKNKKVSKLFKESLREGLKYAQGKPAKVKVETLYVRTTGRRFPYGIGTAKSRHSPGGFVTGADIKEARSILKVSQPQFAKIMAVSPETVKKWEQGKNPIPASVGYWAVGLITHPDTTKKLLYEMAGRYSVES